MAYLPYLWAWNSWVLEHWKDCPSTNPMPEFVPVSHPSAWALFPQCDPILGLNVAGRCKFLQATCPDRHARPLCSSVQLDIHKRTECLSLRISPRTFHLRRRHHTGKGWDYKITKTWWNIFWQTAEWDFFFPFIFSFMGLNKIILKEFIILKERKRVKIVLKININTQSIPQTELKRIFL